MSLTGGWPAMTSPATPEANPHLYVHNVPKDSNEDELRSVFGQYGSVANVRLKVNQKVGPHAVYAFVTFTSTDEARNALVNLQGKELRGRSLRIEFQRAAASSAAAQQVQPQRMTNSVSTAAAPPSHFNVLRVSTPHSSDPASPAKRSRVEHTASSQGVRYVASNDQSGLIDAIKQMLALQRPDLIDPFVQLCNHWMESVNQSMEAASSGQLVDAAVPEYAPREPAVRMWPVSQLSSLQQRLASEGNLELDQETGRWGVLLNKLITSRARTNGFSPEEGAVAAPPPPQQQQPATITGYAGPQFFPPLPPPPPPQPTDGADEAASNTTASATSSLINIWTEKLRLLPAAPLNDEEDGAPRTWRGSMNRNEKRVLAVTVRMLCGELPAILLAPSSCLAITLRSPYEEMLKKTFLGLAVLELQHPEKDAAQLRDYIGYFDTKNRAGVAKLTENTYAYIFPTSAFPTQASATANALLVVFAKSND